MGKVKEFLYDETIETLKTENTVLLNQNAKLVKSLQDIHNNAHTLIEALWFAEEALKELGKENV